jgi:hypothetical protein
VPSPSDPASFTKLTSCQFAKKTPCDGLFLAVHSFRAKIILII